MPPKRTSLSHKARTLVVCLIIGLFAGCEYLAPKQPLTPIYGVKPAEINFLKMIVDPNDPDKVLRYEIMPENSGEHTGVYLSNRVMKQIYGVQVK